MRALETVRYELAAEDRRVALITLDRPSRANSVVPELARDLLSAVENATDDPEARAVVVTGAGRHFCAGADLKELRELERQIREGAYPREIFKGTVRHINRATQAIFNCPKPVIAAINGAATAGGLDLACACDYRFASAEARFGETYVKIALPPMNGGAWLLLRRIGLSKAFEMIASGELIDAEAALSLGLVDRVVPAEKLLPAAIEFARQIAEKPPEVMAWIKRELRTALEGSLADAMARAFVASVEFTQSEGYWQGLQTILSRGE